jgi:sugar lactone lactonase YvrE
MLSKQSSLLEAQTLLTGLAMGESPRWHENRLWLSDWGAREIIAVDLNGSREVAVLGRTGPRLLRLHAWGDGQENVILGSHRVARHGKNL